ncbi:flagellar hook-length control protein FliK [Clostridium sp.]|uniref:flagellar hook-length control protein FliK n=1 Tax=Clostridium sp. TaxID=1506 RepID=UPI002584F9EC|nr:flagellar hook-length control protein FliK [Clostridium sp.]MDU4849364.1 flagellar hook-length control protein FliK [Clostridium sp.]
MPGIYNINNGYANNNKKISSKLTFEVGEKFTGRVVDKGDGKDITIRLSDGWQFIAETDDKVDIEQLKLLKFEVEGFENGKLKLKILKGNAQEVTTEDENFQEIIEKEGLSKEDISILKNMVKHNIPLTRENINQMKGLIQLSQLMNSDPEEINNFIKNYLESNNIDINSREGQNAKELLTKFFNEFKNMTADDILAFIENNLELSEENIKSFNRLFKEDFTIEKLLIKLNENLKQNELSPKDVSAGSNLPNNIENSTQATSTSSSSDNVSTLATKIYNENDPSSKKVDVLDILRTLAGQENKENETVLPKEIDFNKKENVNLSKELLENLESNKDIVRTIKNIIDEDKFIKEMANNEAEKNNDGSAKAKVEQLLSNQEGRKVTLTNDEFKQLTEFINRKFNENEVVKTDSMPKDIQTGKEINEIKNFEIDKLDKLLLNDKNDIKIQIKERINNVADIVKNLLSHTELNENVYDKITNLIRENINDIKVFNTINNEYYYINFPIQSNFQEYPCQLIIKDNRKDGKKIDSTNAKMVVSVKTINLGEIDGYITMIPNKINIKLKCEDEFTRILNKNKDKLIEGLSASGNYVTVTVSSKENPANIVTCREFFNDMSISNIDIRV